MSSLSLGIQPISLSFSPPKSPFQSKSSLSFKTFSSSSKFPVKMSAETIEHVVLFNVKSDTEPSKIKSMVNGLSSLSSLDQVLYLTAGPILRNRSSDFKFTHMLHSRYRSKEDLSAYSADPRHLGVVREFVLPICEDLMAVDWVADRFDGPVVPRSGAAMRLTFFKMKEGLGDGKKGEVLEVIRGVKNIFDSINQITVGENFSPERAKGFSIASLAIFPGLTEMDELHSNEGMVKAQEKIRDLLENVIILDYAIPPLYSANL